MATLIRKVKNELSSDITIRVPGSNPYQVVVLQPSVTVDLLTLLSQDELETLQTELRGLVDRGSVSVQGTIASSALESARIQAQVTLPDAPTAGVGWNQVDVQAMVDLINALKATVNAMNS